ncbi:hypothetical protein LK994_12965 [Ferruginibacter lapsinanis]|uniref:hypothetical protein n=1 Tax=Ferruginibacter lapsinanis TaxID=563172 RepID=UPI001E504E08|nr:hypothetical protein [Ferruginibacter lapsinanis]UEG49545.1 hypothetical protein LK994_12965 [Ferruginibacter lapsinanis]
MSTTNYQGPTIDSGHVSKGTDYKNWIIGFLVVALLSVSSYTLVANNETDDMISRQEATITKVAEERSNIQRSFDESLVRLDSMKTINSGLESKLVDNSNEIAKTKNEIRSILNKKNASAAELGKAKNLIAVLNTKIAGMEQEVARLNQENQTLTQDKIVLTQEKEKLTQDLTATTIVKQDLEKKVDVASTLNASNIAITPVNVKNNGKEKVTTTAKRVDKLLISFVVDNRIIQPATTDVYVCVIGPDGKPVSAAKSGSGIFTTREEGDKNFTAKVAVDLETAQKKNVEFAFTPDQNFQEGNYTIQIYQNGFKIGENNRELKKGGLFS